MMQMGIIGMKQGTIPFGHPCGMIFFGMYRMSSSVVLVMDIVLVVAMMWCRLVPMMILIRMLVFGAVYCCIVHFGMRMIMMTNLRMMICG